MWNILCAREPLIISQKQEELTPCTKRTKFWARNFKPRGWEDLPNYLRFDYKEDSWVLLASAAHMCHSTPNSQPKLPRINALTIKNKFRARNFGDYAGINHKAENSLRSKRARKRLRS